MAIDAIVMCLASSLSSYWISNQPALSKFKDEPGGGSPLVFSVGNLFATEFVEKLVL